MNKLNQFSIFKKFKKKKKKNLVIRILLILMKIIIIIINSGELLEVNGSRFGLGSE